MATSKTGSFWLTESVSMAAGLQQATGTLDLGSLVDVGDKQGVSVEQIDVIWQEAAGSPLEYNCFVGNAVAASAGFDVQVTDQNPGGVILRADDSSIVGSAALLLDDTAPVVSPWTDLNPDRYGKLDESRIVINDQLYIVSTSTQPIAATRNLVATVRIKARIVKLNTRDFMSIAIQSTAADN